MLKAPPLELVGWFAIASSSGPHAVHVPLHRQLLESYNESAVFLAFHPSADASTAGGRLPLTLYESVYEAERSDDGTKDGRAGGSSVGTEAEGGQMQLRFREVPYTIETGEAEMISVDFVARGGGNAAAVDRSGPREGTARDAVTNKGKGRDLTLAHESASTTLSAEEDECEHGATTATRPPGLTCAVIAALTARVNAIKVLHSRIRLLQTYLANLPPCYLTSGTLAPGSTSSSPTEIHHPILRSIQALVHRLPLVMPTDRALFAHEMQAERDDVSLVALLGTVNKSVQEVREVGRKFSVRPGPRVVAMIIG